MAEPIRILLVEDDPEDIRTIWNMLHEKSRFQTSVEAVKGIPEALERLKADNIDIVLLDLSLVSPQAEMEAVQEFLEAQPNIALIVLTELENEEEGLRALEAGAQDYLLKAEIGTHALVRSLHYAVERQKAGTLIHTAEQRHRLATNSIVDYAIITLDEQGKITDWSKGAENVFGYSEKDAVEQPFAMLFTPEDRAAGVPAQELVKAGQKGFAEDERWHIRQDGSRFYASGMTRPIYTEKGQVQGFVKILRDTTQRQLNQMIEDEKRQLAEILRDTAAVLNSTLLLEEVLERALTCPHKLLTFEKAVIVLVEDGKLTHVSSQGLDETDEAKLKAWYEQAENLNTLPPYQTVARTGQPLLMNHQDRQDVDLPVVFGHTVLVVPLLREKSPIGYLTFITSNPREFRETDLPKLQAFSYQVVAAVQNAKHYLQGQELAAQHERQQLARNLHDEVVQTLYSASVIVQSFQRHLEYKPEEIIPLLSDVDRLLQGAMSEMRVLLLELRPSNLQALPLSQLLRQLTTVVKGRMFIETHFEFEGEPTLPGDVRTAIYRIAQEALNNIVKHSQAKQLWISGRGEKDFIELRIRDNGQGFATNGPASGMGQQIMRERAEEIDARFEVQSSPGKGTEVHVVWPKVKA